MPQIPASAADIADRHNDLVRRVAALETARPLEAATIGRGGIQVQSGGSISVYDQTNHSATFFTGRRGFNAPPAGGAVDQMITSLNREDGSAALQLADLNTTPGHPFRQALQWWDRTGGNIVLSDDANGGVGIARPHLPMTLQPMPLTLWPTTTSAVMSNLMLGYQERQNPGFAWSLWLHADAATTGVFQVTVDGTVVATSPSVTNSFVVWNGSYYWPAGWTFGSLVAIEVDGQRTAGAGTVSAQTLILEGVQSP